MIDALVKKCDAAKTQMNITNKNIAEKGGVSPASVSRFFSQKGHGVTAETIEAICSVLGIDFSIEKLYDDQTEKEALRESRLEKIYMARLDEKDAEILRQRRIISRLVVCVLLLVLSFFAFLLLEIFVPTKGWLRF